MKICAAELTATRREYAQSQEYPSRYPGSRYPRALIWLQKHFRNLAARIPPLDSPPQRNTFATFLEYRRRRAHNLLVPQTCAHTHTHTEQPRSAVKSEARFPFRSFTHLPGGTQPIQPHNRRLLPLVCLGSRARISRKGPRRPLDGGGLLLYCVIDYSNRWLRSGKKRSFGNAQRWIFVFAKMSHFQKRGCLYFCRDFLFSSRNDLNLVS